MEVVLWACGGLGLVAAVAAAVVVESTRVELDLQLVAAAEGAPGRAIGARAFVFDVSDPRPRLLPLPVAVSLVDRTGRRRHQTVLEASASRGAEGSIDLRGVEAGAYDLVAEVEVGGAHAQVSTRLDVTPTPMPAPLASRAVLPLQEYRAFAIRPEPRRGDPDDPAVEDPLTLDAALVPSALDLRVPGGACIPNVTCVLLVRVGAPAAALGIEARVGFERTDDVVRSPHTQGIVRIEGIVTGPEAEVDIVAFRDDAAVARRTVRLPVLLGGVGLELVELRGGAPVVRVRGGEADAVVVDMFRRGVWERATSISGSAQDAVSVSGLPLDPGPWVIQVRTDPFGTSRAMTRVVEVGTSPGVPERDEALFERALDERFVHPLPSAVSSVRAARLELREQQADVRRGAFGVIALGALLVVALVFRRGIRGGAQARAILAAAGDPEAQARRRRAAMFLTVLAVAAAVVLIFAVLALWIHLRTL